VDMLRKRDERSGSRCEWASLLLREEADSDTGGSTLGDRGNI
jgi:hypothetical protein